MKKELDIILKSILEDAKQGYIKTTLGGIRVGFNTTIENKNVYLGEQKYTLEINNYDLLLDKIEKYLFTLLKSNHKWLEVPSRNITNQFDINTLRDYIAYLFLYMTPYDFKHPESFFDRYRDFLLDQTFSMPQEYDLELLDCKMHIIREEQDYGQETPYALVPILEKEIDGKVCKYVLPYLRYGISYENGEKTCFLYAIQNHNQKYTLEEERVFQKKMERKLYKLSSKLPQEYSDTVNSFVFSENVLLAVLEKLEISSLMIGENQPLKTMVKENVFTNHTIPEGMSKSKLQSLGYVFDVDRIIHNVTTKFLLTSKRCSYQNPNYQYQDLNEGYGMLKNYHLGYEVENKYIAEIYDSIINTEKQQHR